MATTITGKLNKPASQFQAGESTGFGIRLGVKYYDRETRSDQWTNYEAVVFAKAAAQVQFYQQVLVEGSIVEVSGDKLAIKQYQGQNGLLLSIQLIDAKLCSAYAPQVSAPAQQPPAQRPAQQPVAQQQAQNARRPAPPAGYQGQMPQQYQQPQGGFNQNEFDDQIPF